MRSLVSLLSALAMLVLLASCGSEPPTPGELEVTSLPSGAAILIDGVDTGEVTPAVITDLDGGTYTIALQLTGVEFRPGERQVDVSYGARTATHFQTGASIVEVTSTPAGASIILDGVDTGEVTPHTFNDVDPGQHEVDVRLLHHRTAGGPQTIETEVGGEAAVDFTLVIGRVVLFEGFSNVRCVGCPEFLEDVETVIAEPEYGFDKVVFVKYAGSVPYPLDPLYRSNTAMVIARSQFYANQPSFALPSMFWDGELSGGYGTPASADAMRGYIDEHHDDAVDIYLEVTATGLDELETADVSCEITLSAPYAAVDMSDYTLRAVLLYDEVETEEHFEPGGDLYHWVARVDAEVTDSIGTLDAGATETYQVTLSDPDPETFGLTPHGREVVVFAQNATDKSIIQVGSTMLTTAQPAAAGHAPSGGSR
ncbi:PEGA domain-containing protein [bacterium]|nr:PEGA domain-containing protein [bacterium]